MIRIENKSLAMASPCHPCSLPLPVLHLHHFVHCIQLRIMKNRLSFSFRLVEEGIRNTSGKNIFCKKTNCLVPSDITEIYIYIIYTEITTF